MKQATGMILATVLGTAAIARAQPAPADPPTPYDPPAAPDAGRAGPARPTGSAPSRPAPASPGSPDDPGPLLGGQADPQRDPAPPRPIVHKPLRFPVVVTTPTGWLLPAGVLYSRNALDTGGGVVSDNRVGLGDVAEFGLATTDEVRERAQPEAKPAHLQPYVTASFRLGVDEHRLFAGQPGVTLGFRKSFEREHSGFKTRIAELTLVASKHLGPDVALHLGGALWDASLQSTDESGAMPPPEITLHGHLQHQLRAFGGFEARPLPRSQILIDLGWAPEFCYACTGDTDQIKLRPQLSWGVRYQLARSVHIESGVRVPDIGNFNLLDAQIFGQITLTSFALADAVETLK
jgi:hypothetical protein